MSLNVRRTPERFTAFWTSNAVCAACCNDVELFSAAIWRLLLLWLLGAVYRLTSVTVPLATSSFSSRPPAPRIGRPRRGSKRKPIPLHPYFRVLCVIPHSSLLLGPVVV